MTKRTVDADNSTKTIFSGSAYCSPAQFGQRYDVRSLAQRLSDSGEDVSDALSDAKLAVFLQEASGKVEAAATMGESYTADDLTALAADTSNMAELLHGLVADLTIPIVFKRRPEVIPQFPQVQEAQQFLQALAQGKKIFGFQEAMAAGHMESQSETPTDEVNRNLWTYQARRFFGTRGNRIPRGTW